VLRGAQNAAVLDKNYQTLSTYGIGKDKSWQDWQHYVIQLINQGYCEIAFHQHNALKLTDFSRKVLFENHAVQLTHPSQVKEKTVVEKEARATGSKKDSLFGRLRTLRYRIAQEEGIPAYLVFSDATL